MKTLAYLLFVAAASAATTSAQTIEWLDWSGYSTSGSVLVHPVLGRVSVTTDFEPQGTFGYPAGTLGGLSWGPFSYVNYDASSTGTGSSINGTMTFTFLDGPISPATSSLYFSSNGLAAPGGGLGASTYIVSGAPVLVGAIGVASGPATYVPVGSSLRITGTTGWNHDPDLLQLGQSPVTAITVAISQITGDGAGFTIGAAPSSSSEVLYALTSSDLVVIDASTGGISQVVGPHGVPAGQNAFNLAYDPVGGRLFGLSIQVVGPGFDCRLYEYDRASGLATLLIHFPGAQLGGMDYVESVGSLVVAEVPPGGTRQNESHLRLLDPTSGLGATYLTTTVDNDKLVYDNVLDSLYGHDGNGTEQLTRLTGGVQPLVPLAPGAGDFAFGAGNGGLFTIRSASELIRIVTTGGGAPVSEVSVGSVPGGGIRALAFAPFVELCQPDLGFQGPGTAVATLCGTGLDVGESSDYEITGAPGNGAGALLFSVPGFPDIPFQGGTLVSFGGYAVQVPLFASPGGTVSLTFGGLPHVVDLVFQSVFLDAALPQQVAFTNAVLAQYGQ